MTDEEKPGEKTQGPGEMLRSVFERIGETLDVTAKVARLNLDIGVLNSRRAALFQEMGRKVYELYGKGLVKNAALLSQCAEAAEIDAEVARKRAEIAELRGHAGRAEPAAETEEMGIEEDVGAAETPTTAEDLTEEEEREVRPPGDRKL